MHCARRLGGAPARFDVPEVIQKQPVNQFFNPFAALLPGN
jgi:hypothetical protein